MNDLTAKGREERELRMREMMFGKRTKDGFALIDTGDISESPTVDRTTATGRARCRICGEKIAKGSIQIVFHFSLTDGSYNSWTAIEGKAHEDCAPNCRNR